MAAHVVAGELNSERRCSECYCRLARDNRDTMCWPCRRRTAIRAHEESAAGIRRREVFEEGGIPALARDLGVTPAEAIRYAVEEGILPRRWRANVEGLVRLADLEGTTHVEAAQLIGVSRWTIADWRRQLRLEPS